MQQHFHLPLTLAEVAAQAHLSPNYFSERFTHVAGVTFGRYPQALRLEFAGALLGAFGAACDRGLLRSWLPHPLAFRAYKHRYGRSPIHDRGRLVATPA